ncbi:MAG: hypothetical protein HYX41_03450 [Bdellovibrio sp.]|nr:hypothetical protein [Bdellovibrio sp.]
MSKLSKIIAKIGASFAILFFLNISSGNAEGPQAKSQIEDTLVTLEDPHFMPDTGFFPLAQSVVTGIERFIQSKTNPGLALKYITHTQISLEKQKTEIKAFLNWSNLETNLAPTLTQLQTLRSQLLGTLSTEQLALAIQEEFRPFQNGLNSSDKNPTLETSSLENLQTYLNPLKTERPDFFGALTLAVHEASKSEQSEKQPLYHYYFECLKTEAQTRLQRNSEAEYKDTYKEFFKEQIRLLKLSGKSLTQALQGMSLAMRAESPTHADWFFESAVIPEIRAGKFQKTVAPLIETVKSSDWVLGQNTSDQLRLSQSVIEKTLQLVFLSRETYPEEYREILFSLKSGEEDPASLYSPGHLLRTANRDNPEWDIHILKLLRAPQISPTEKKLHLDRRQLVPLINGSETLIPEVYDALIKEEDSVVLQDLTSVFSTFRSSRQVERIYLPRLIASRRTPDKNIALEVIRTTYNPEDRPRLRGMIQEQYVEDQTAQVPPGRRNGWLYRNVPTTAFRILGEHYSPLEQSLFLSALNGDLGENLFLASFHTITDFNITDAKLVEKMGELFFKFKSEKRLKSLLGKLTEYFSHQPEAAVLEMISQQLSRHSKDKKLRTTFYPLLKILNDLKTSGSGP